MSFSETVEGSALAKSIHVTDTELVVELTDGRKVCIPIEWYPRLMQATPAERSDYKLIGNGSGIHWPQLDEDISVEGILAGRHSAESAESFDRWLSARK